ncbi:hypothetical protein QVA66_04070 [Staphylococcus chromogenes]|nr:hypothetical protein [Staphylococcus chromogenes]
METLMSLARESFAIPAHACRLLVRHWPALIAVLAFALSTRAGVLWLALLISDRSALLAQLVLPLAPIAMMTGIVISLWLMQPSLPFLANATHAKTKCFLSTTRLLTIGGLLIPFLTVYATHDLLAETATLSFTMPLLTNP